MGLGYVGLPLALKCLKNGYITHGIDVNEKLIQEYKKQVFPEEIFKDFLNTSLKYENFNLHSSFEELKNHSFDYIIVTVPTPITKNNNPDLTMLESCSKSIGRIIKKNCIVVYESTVFPTATRDVCLELIKMNTDLDYPSDFGVGYSPERIVPGFNNNEPAKYTKIISADSKKNLSLIHDFYSSILEIDIHLADTIEIAESAKLLENVQRDLNIALMNNLVPFFKKLDISFTKVLKAAKTKWNFTDVQPGLVGGHCIGVDTYYLLHMAKKINANVELVESGRQINEDQIEIVAKQITSLFHNPERIALLGVTFKANTADVRNSAVIRVADKLKKLCHEVDLFDPYAAGQSTKGFEIKDTKNIENEYHCDVLFIGQQHDAIINDIDLFIKKLNPEKVISLQPLPTNNLDYECVFK